MEPFTPYQERDAWFVIRGYVYQVHVTILEWLTLSPGYEMWLECGEDIDRVQKDLGRPDFGDGRVLEQIKHRQKAATLRSADVIGAIVSFFRHARTNPNLKLKFRFLTTSKIGREQKSDIPLMAEPALLKFGKRCVLVRSRPKQKRPQLRRSALFFSKVQPHTQTSSSS